MNAVMKFSFFFATTNFVESSYKVQLKTGNREFISQVVGVSISHICKSSKLYKKNWKTDDTETI